MVGKGPTQNRVGDMSVQRRIFAWTVGPSIAVRMILGVAGFVGVLTLLPEPASAQGLELIVDIGATSPPGGLPMGSMLPPREILAALRSAGFDPLSRPVARGGVYVVFALNRYYMDVQVRVDGRSGRVLSVTRLAGAAYGGPIYEGHLPALQRGYPPAYAPPAANYEHPPVPPANVPLAPPARNFGAAAPSRSGAPETVAKKSAPPQAPVPRVRPEDNPPSAAPDSSAADQTGSSAAPPPPPGAASPAPQPSGMVPIAPLE
jgi:hypothetical protein